jgi:hypothetical protein
MVWLRRRGPRPGPVTSFTYKLRRFVPTTLCDSSSNDNLVSRGSSFASTAMTSHSGTGLGNAIEDVLHVILKQTDNIDEKMQLLQLLQEKVAALEATVWEHDQQQQELHAALIMEACPRQLLALKSLLHTFADSTGLKVNYAKTSMHSINTSQDELCHLASTFHCSTDSFPFTYLGLPLSLNKPTVQDCLPLVDRVERRLISTSIFLNQGGKLQMVNYVLSSLPTFYMCSMKMPQDIWNQIDKYRRHCLW